MHPIDVAYDALDWSTVPMIDRYTRCPVWDAEFRSQFDGVLRALHPDAMPALDALFVPAPELDQPRDMKHLSCAEEFGHHLLMEAQANAYRMMSPVGVCGGLGMSIPRVAYCWNRSPSRVD